MLLLLFMLLLLLLLGKVVGGREVGKESSGRLVAFLDEWIVFQHARGEQEDGASVNMCHEVCKGSGGVAGGELQKRCEHLPSQTRIRPDGFVEQGDGLRRNRRGDGAPGVSRAEVGRDAGRGLSRGGGAAAGRRGGVAGGREGHERNNVQEHEEA